MNVRWMRMLLLGLCGALSAFARAGPTDPAGAEFFEKKVRPVLSANCLACHGPEKQKAGLRLDSRAVMLTGGDSGPAIVPGHPEERLEDVVPHVRERARWFRGERLARLGIEKHIPRANQLFVQLCVPEQAVARQVCNLCDGAPRTGIFVRHDF